MKNLFNTNQIKLLVFLAIISFFAIFYWQTVMSLPLFGDATIHGANALDVLNGGWRSLSAEYPAFYSYQMSILYSIFGEKGFNLVPFIGILFLLVSTFLLIKQITKNYYLSILAIIFVACSPKIIFFSARMYQEITLSGLIIFCIYLLFKYLENKERKSLLLLSFFIGVVMSIKQQGLFILYPSIIIFFIINFLKKQIKFIDILLVSLLPILISFSFYGVLFHTVGKIQPGSDEFYLFKIINTTGQNVFSYHDKNLNNNITNRIKENSYLDSKFKEIQNKYSLIAFKRAEARHIWPTEIFTNFEKFNQANNLYINVQGKILEKPIIMYMFFVLLILGFIYCIFNFRIYSNILIFSFIFLSINYVLFSRNSDQQRYHIFIPIYLLIFSLLFFKFLLKRLGNINNRKLFAVIGLILVLFIPVLLPRTLINTRWNNSQLYSPSEGGINSVKEMGVWLKNNSKNDTLVGQQCGNETHYYSQRNVIGNWEAYFLDEKALDIYFKNTNISYYVIYKSQIVNDEDWAIICWVPNSFYERMEKNYKKVYTTKKTDIFVYKIN